jgi:tetratricopeptide (TPR) repeat protein
LDKGEYELAVECYQKCLAISERHGQKYYICNAVGNIGNVNLYKGDYEAAMEYYERQLGIAQELGNKQIIATTMGNMGIVYDLKNQYEQAMTYYEKALESSEELGDREGISRHIGNMGIIYKNRGELAKAMACFTRQLTIKRELGHKQGVSLTLGNIAGIFRKQKKYDLALDYYNDALQIANEIHSKYLLLNLVNKAEILFLIGELESAKTINSQGLSIAQDVGYHNYIFRGKLLAAKIDFAQGNKNASEVLYKMVDDVEEDDGEVMAMLQYELYNMETGQQKKICGKKALALYRKLYDQLPDMEYQERIEEIMREMNGN